MFRGFLHLGRLETFPAITLHVLAAAGEHEPLGDGSARTFANQAKRKSLHNLSCSRNRKQMGLFLSSAAAASSLFKHKPQREIYSEKHHAKGWIPSSKLSKATFFMISRAMGVGGVYPMTKLTSMEVSSVPRLVLATSPYFLCGCIMLIRMSQNKKKSGKRTSWAKEEINTAFHKAVMEIRTSRSLS